MALEFGLALPPAPRRERLGESVEDLAATLTAFGGVFGSVWKTDHFQRDDEPVHEAWTVIAYLAARFPTLRVGTIVLGQSYRNPALLAKMGATLQWLSGGRLTLGIGAGWKEDEYRAYGYPFPGARVRVEQLEDTLEIVRRLWTEPDPVTYRGRHYHIEKAVCVPRPQPVPPILVGGGGRTTMRLAVRYGDVWNMPDAAWPEYAQRLDTLRALCAAEGRDPATLRLSWFGRLAVHRTLEQAVALSGGKWTPERAFVGTPAQVIEQIRPFVEAGVDLFLPQVLGLEEPEVVELLLEEVFPAVRRM